MTYTDYCEWYEDSGIFSTHIPRDENNQPIQSLVDRLEPAVMIRLVPPELGFSRDVIRKLGAVEGDDDLSEISEDGEEGEKKINSFWNKQQKTNTTPTTFT